MFENRSKDTLNIDFTLHEKSDPIALNNCVIRVCSLAVELSLVTQDQARENQSRLVLCVTQILAYHSKLLHI